jgi:hypothetical protein
MKIDELVAKAKDSLEARMVYAEPYEKNGITVIAAARITRIRARSATCCAPAE